MDIGDLTAYLGLDTTRFDKGINRSTKSFLTLKKTIATLGIGLLAYKLNSASKQWEALYKKQEQADAGLRQVMISMNRYSDSAYQSMLDLAKATQASTTFGDEAVESGTKMLMTFRDITDDVMPRTIRAMADLSALTGRDLVASANLLGRASMGLTGELRRVGITVDRVVYEQEGFLGILKQIESQVSGQAMVLARTKSGGMQQYLNIVNDLREHLGNLTLIIKMEFVPHLLKIVNNTSNWFDKQKKLQDLGLPNFFDTTAKAAKGLADILFSIVDRIGRVQKFLTFAKRIAPEMDVPGGFFYTAAGRSWQEQYNPYGDVVEKNRQKRSEMPALKQYPPFVFGDKGYYQYLSQMHIIAEKQKTLFQQMAEGAQTWSNSFGDMLNDMAWRSDVTFKHILKSFGQMITRMVIKHQIEEPLFGPKGAITQFIAQGFGGFFSKINWGGGANFGTATIGGETFGYSPGYAYAKGGIINRPTVFPMANGLGYAGEKGLEAVVPLERMPSGDLGVKTNGSQGGGVFIFNIQAMDVKSFNDFFEEFTQNNPNAVLNPLINARRLGAKI